MKRGKWLYHIAICVSVLSFSIPSYGQKPTGNVILLMLDGVRWQEVFKGVDPTIAHHDGGEIFSFLLKEFLKEGFLFGDPEKNEQMEVANPYLISLPGYQSIMAGYTQPCKTNDCGRITVETFEERLIREWNLNKNEVAVIASWKQIPLAVEHIAGTIFTNAGLEPLIDEFSDPEFEKLNEMQIKDQPPWKGNRYDRYTFAHAIHYLKKHKPRFLFISLLDSDAWGHEKNYEQYVATLKQYDFWIKQLIELLKAEGTYGANTTLLITTDHGRGNGKKWKDHGRGLQESKYVWIYGRSPYTNGTFCALNHNSQVNTARQYYTHLDIRPTIEAALGMKPQSCENCGHVITEIMPVCGLN